jgi:hypothetical protein
MFPFVRHCQQATGKEFVVQEDKAPAHAHWFQARTYSVEGISRLLWCGNSPDLNAIEQAWPELKRQTTAKGAPQSRQQATKAWEKAWESLPQSKIKAWIERIPDHIQEIIKLNGGNEYKEGRKAPRLGDPSTAWSRYSVETGEWQDDDDTEEGGRNGLNRNELSFLLGHSI